MIINVNWTFSKPYLLLFYLCSNHNVVTIAYLDYTRLSRAHIKEGNKNLPSTNSQYVSWHKKIPSCPPSPKVSSTSLMWNSELREGWEGYRFLNAVEAAGNKWSLFKVPLSLRASRITARPMTNPWALWWLRNSWRQLKLLGSTLCLPPQCPPLLETLWRETFDHWFIDTF